MKYTDGFPGGPLTNQELAYRERMSVVEAAATADGSDDEALSAADLHVVMARLKRLASAGRDDDMLQLASELDKRDLGVLLVSTVNTLTALTGS